VNSKVRAPLAVLALLGACGFAACIGPKHDDPDDVPALGDTGGEDTGATATPDTGGLDLDASADDTGTVPPADSETPSSACGDAGDSGDAACPNDAGDASSDASSDAPSDAPETDALGGD
jgi:hypothetical protein